MALTVEDGTGLASADSYLSVADADTYHTDHGDNSSWSGAATAAKEEALRLGTQYLDAMYGQRWLGTRTNESQALDWPRADVEDYDRFSIASNVVPQAIKDAVAEAARRSISETDGLLPDIDEPGTIKSESDAVGALKTSTTYTGGKSQIPRFRIIDLLVAGLVRSSSTMERA